MKDIKYVVFLMMIIAIAISIYTTVQPNDYTITRTKIINAPAGVIYNEVVNLNTWKEWNTWVKDSKNVIDSSYDHEKNNIYSWENNGLIGQLKTISTNLNTSVSQEIEISEYPTSNINWEFKKINPETTEVQCTVIGKQLSFGFKANAIFSGGITNLIAPHYDNSLNLLDKKVLRSMKRHSINVEGISNYKGSYLLKNTTSCKAEDFSTKKKELLALLGHYFSANNIIASGPPFVMYYNNNKQDSLIHFSCAIPTLNKVKPKDTSIVSNYLKDFKALKTILKGEYKNLPEAWKTTFKYQKETELQLDKTQVAIEVFLNEKTSTPNPADLRTILYLPLK